MAFVSGIPGLIRETVRYKTAAEDFMEAETKREILRNLGRSIRLGEMPLCGGSSNGVDRDSGISSLQAKRAATLKP